MQTFQCDIERENLLAFSRVQPAGQDVEVSPKASCWGIRGLLLGTFVRDQPVGSCLIVLVTQVHSLRFWAKVRLMRVDATYVKYWSPFLDKTRRVIFFFFNSYINIKSGPVLYYYFGTQNGRRWHEIFGENVFSVRVRRWKEWKEVKMKVAKFEKTFKERHELNLISSGHPKHEPTSTQADVDIFSIPTLLCLFFLPQNKQKVVLVSKQFFRRMHHRWHDSRSSSVGFQGPFCYC